MDRTVTVPYLEILRFAASVLIGTKTPKNIQQQESTTVSATMASYQLVTNAKVITPLLFNLVFFLKKPEHYKI